MLPVFYRIVEIGRQWLVKDWNEDHILKMKNLGRSEACCVSMLQALVLRKRKALDVTTLTQSETRSRLRSFILDDQNTRTRTLRWRGGEGVRKPSVN